MLPDGVSVAAAVGAAVEMEIERVLEIANTTMAELESATVEGTTSFKNIEPSAAHFSSVPLAVEFHAQQQAAKDTFLSTIEGIVADLQAFAQQLRTTAESTEAADEAARATLTGFGETFVDYDYATDVNYDAGRGDEALNSTGAQQGEGGVAATDGSAGGETGGSEVPASDTPAPQDAPGETSPGFTGRG